MSSSTRSTVAIEHIKLKKPSSKPTILFAHGLGFDRSFWRPLINENRSDYNAIIYDLEGVGESEPSRHAATMEQMVKTLLWVAKRSHRKDDLILCGHGLGGSVVLRALEVAPERFSGAIIIGALPLAPTKRETLDVSNVLGELENSNTTRAASYIKEIVERALHPESGQRDRVLEHTIFHSPQSLVWLLTAQITRVDTTLALVETTLPLLLITGEHDRVTEPRAFLEISLNKDGASFVRVPEASHFTPLEYPVAIHRALQGFIKRIAPQKI